MKQLRKILKYLFSIIFVYSNSICNVSAVHLFSNDVGNRPIFSALNNKLASKNFIRVSFEKAKQQDRTFGKFLQRLKDDATEASNTLLLAKLNNSSLHPQLQEMYELTVKMADDNIDNIAKVTGFSAASMLPIVGDYTVKTIKYAAKLKTVIKIEKACNNAFINTINVVKQLPGNTKVIQIDCFKTLHEIKNTQYAQKFFQLIDANKDYNRILELTDHLKDWNKTKKNLFFKDLITTSNQYVNSAQLIGNNLHRINKEIIDTWALLKNSKPNLSLDIDVLEALNNARKNSGLVSIGFDELKLTKLMYHPQSSYIEVLRDVNALGDFIKNNPTTQLVNFKTRITVLSGNAPNQVQGAHGVIKEIIENTDLYKGKIISFEKSVPNNRGTTSYIDIYTNDVPPKMIERKWITSGKIDEETFLKEFVERDLFNATDLSQIKWSIKKGANNDPLTKTDLNQYLSHRMEEKHWINLARQRLSYFFLLMQVK